MKAIPSTANTARSSTLTTRLTSAISSARSISGLRRSSGTFLTTPKKKRGSAPGLGRRTRREGGTSLSWNSEFLNSDSS
jgi:hypothetical protein